MHYTDNCQVLQTTFASLTLADEELEENMHTLNKELSFDLKSLLGSEAQFHGTFVKFKSFCRSKQFFATHIHSQNGFIEA